jgi:hypothetical protein
MNKTAIATRSVGNRAALGQRASREQVARKKDKQNNVVLLTNKHFAAINVATLVFSVSTTARKTFAFRPALIIAGGKM